MSHVHAPARARTITHAHTPAHTRADVCLLLLLHLCACPHTHMQSTRTRKSHAGKGVHSHRTTNCQEGLALCPLASGTKLALVNLHALDQALAPQAPEGMAEGMDKALQGSFFGWHRDCFDARAVTETYSDSEIAYTAIVNGEGGKVTPFVLAETGPDLEPVSPPTVVQVGTAPGAAALFRAQCLHASRVLAASSRSHSPNERNIKFGVFFKKAKADKGATSLEPP